MIADFLEMHSEVKFASEIKLKKRLFGGLLAHKRAERWRLVRESDKLQERAEFQGQSG